MVPEQSRAEWEGGDVILPAPATRDHSDVHLWLLCILGDFIEEHDLGKLMGLGFSMRLGELRRFRVSDLLFIRKAHRQFVHPYFLDGPADLIVEVTSNDSSVRDWRTKYYEYAQAGVAEYWVVDPLLHRFDAYSLKSKQYQQLPVDDGGKVHSKVLRGLYIKPAWLWRKPLPKLGVVLKELGLR